MGIERDPHPLFQQYAHPEKFVSAAWLSARLGVDGLKVVESDEDAFLYDIGHIPGAVRIDWRRDLNDPVVRDYIDGAAFAELMSARGISRDDTVIIYGDRSNWWAAFTAWVFELFGHPDVRLLDGGRDAWMGEERDMSFAVPDYPRADYPVVEREDGPFRTFADELLGRPPRQLIDVRTPEHFHGHVPLDGPFQRSGHIPGAINVPWGGFVHPNSLFKSYPDVEKEFTEFDRDERTVVYCQLGESSAHTWYVLRHILGFSNVSLYDGSWAEWGNMVRVPVEHTPFAPTE
ncbi:Putative thiosulfate sulfurtransferase SseA [Corynebacterium capitovis DSM 44611]|uniref:sulfurtransferase n=1 Tax=Corynebacterium capitovis TaxID=131081 RepID=UPI0003630532|nr:sulfurtransferase [Corynebacterium capitovis]WKD56985.1 Putative thiosulfate sulfurtransferase SseA [Corynebacterium capitovis DSM 44611]